MNAYEAQTGLSPRYAAPTPKQGPELASMARHCFVETFGERYRREDLEPFLDTAYGPQGLLADLADPATDFRIAHADGGIVAFVKISPLNAPATAPLPGALELRQIYVLKSWHGTGIANALMKWALDRARQRQAPEIYLTVFDDNVRAKRFYARHGFVDVGGCPFQVGTQIDDDRIWRRPLQSAVSK